MPETKAKLPMNVQINVTEYVRAHGHHPRGYGMWVFRFGGPIHGERTYTGYYSETKRQAIADAKNNRVTVITVGS